MNKVECHQLDDPHFTLQEWQIIIEDLISEHGIHAVLSFDAGYNNISAEIHKEEKMSEKFEAINQEVIKAMKAKDSNRVLVLRTLVGSIKSIAIAANRKEVNDEDVLSALTKGVKQREDSITQFTSAGRTDLVENETFQLSVLKEFLPAQMSEDEIKNAVLEAVERISAGGDKSKKLKGLLMKDLNPKLKGKADMKYVNQLIDSILV